MKTIFLALLVVFSACKAQTQPDQQVKKLPDRDTKGIQDSVCDIPIFGCIYELRLVDSCECTRGDTLIKIRYYKHIPQKKHPMGVWFSEKDATAKVVYVKGEFVYSEMRYKNEKDSVRDDVWTISFK